MKRVITGTFLAAAFAVGVSAQQTVPQSQPTQEGKDAAKTVTVTGCLKAGDAPDSFVLSDIKWDKDKDKDRASAVGTSGSATPPAIAAATSLKLIPSASTKLTDHVGHTVEVSGSINDKGLSAAPAAPSDPASARPAKAEAALDVRNVKMVSPTCSM